MKIVDYAVIYGDDAFDLAKKVWNLIKEDWQPFGSVVIDPRNGFYYQSVIKYEQET